MPTNNIQQLYSDYRTATEYPPEYTLDFFSKNTLLFNSIKSFTDEGELKLYAEMVYQYLSALYKKGRYNETVDTADKHLQIIESEFESLKLNSIKDDWYYGILYFKATATCQLRDYKTSTEIFKQLVAYDSENENYRNWLSTSQYGQRLWISKTITIICFSWLVIEILFKQYIPSFMVRMSINGIVLTGLIGTLIYEYYIKRSRRKS